MGNQTVGQLRLEPGGFRRHDLTGIGDRHQIAHLRGVHGEGDATVWSTEERLVVQLADALHREQNVSDALWREMRCAFAEDQLIELLMLAGFYRTVSYLTNVLRLPLEPDAVRFPAPYIEASSIAR